MGSAFPIFRTADYVVFATGGHCVYAMGGFASQITLFPALTGDEEPYGSYTVGSDNLRTSEEWKAQGRGREESDYGAILVKTKEQLPMMPVAILSDDQLFDRDSYVCGYSAHKARIHGNYAWLGGGRIVRVTPHRVYHTNDTDGGMGGCPIYTWDDKNRLCAIGIQTYGGNPNSGQRLTKPIIQEYFNWANSVNEQGNSED